MSSRRSIRNAAVAAAAYLILTIGMTWPLAQGLARDVPGDFGDPLLNAWILAWDADHMLDAAGGHPGALADYWNANIFYPHPLALAYSEHLTAQALQVFPIYGLTHNPILCYNLVFLSTFVLSGLGMFLWIRELTGRSTVAFVAGIAFAFAPYRFGAAPHLQVISSAWMPFTLFGFRRFFDSGRLRPLAGGAAAWILQNLSCGYYLLYFSPVVLMYLVWELTMRAAWRDRRVLMALAASGAVIGAITLAFLMPYLHVRQLGFSPRTLFEVDHYSADVYGYLTADENLRFSGWLQAFPKSEGTLFQGFVVMLLGAVAVAASWRAAWRSTPARAGRAGRIVGWLFLATTAAVIAMLFGWTSHAKVGPVSLKVTDFDRLLTIWTALAVLALSLVPRARAAVRRYAGSPAGIFSILTLFGVVMSFGPHIDTLGRTIEEHNLYRAFYLWVPGFDGLRVPARFAMIVSLTLGTLAALGLATVERRIGGRRLAVVTGALILIEAFSVPLPINGYSPEYRQPGLTPLPNTVGVGRRTPEVYRYVAGRLPADASIIELPFGEVAFDVRYQLYSTTHWRRLVNGYSGGSPADYGLLNESLKDVPTRPDRAWQTLATFQPGYAIVHETSYVEDHGHQISDWLRAHGATELGYFFGDRVFQLAW